MYFDQKTTTAYGQHRLLYIAKDPLVQELSVDEGSGVAPSDSSSNWNVGFYQHLIHKGRHTREGRYNFLSEKILSTAHHSLKSF